MELLKRWFGRTPETPIDEEKKMMVLTLRRVMEGGYHRRVSLRLVTKMALDRTDRESRKQVLQALRKSGLITGICQRNRSMVMLDSRARQLIAA